MILFGANCYRRSGYMSPQYHIIGDMAQLGCFFFTRLSQYVEVLHSSRNLYSRGNHSYVSWQWSCSFHKCAYFHCSWTTCSPWSSSKVPYTLENVLHKLKRSHGLTRSCQNQRWRRAQLDLGEKIDKEGIIRKEGSFAERILAFE